MESVVIRLTKGMDLKRSIQEICIKNNILAGVVVSSVGSLLNVNIRNAGATNIVNIQKELEIISLNGTVSNKRIHLHISVSDADLNVYGGHLLDNSLVNTTVELVILKLDNYEFDKEFDNETSYNEIKIIQKNIVE